MMQSLLQVANGLTESIAIKWVDGLPIFQKKEEFELAMQKLILLAIERPEDALQIIHHVARNGASDDTLDQMTAGPLQTTLDRHGDAVRGLVESYSASSPVFKEMVRDAHP